MTAGAMSRLPAELTGGGDACRTCTRMLTCGISASMRTPSNVVCSSSFVSSCAGCQQLAGLTTTALLEPTWSTFSTIMATRPSTASIVRTMMHLHVQSSMF